MRDQHHHSLQHVSAAVDFCQHPDFYVDLYGASNANRHDHRRIAVYGDNDGSEQYNNNGGGLLNHEHHDFSANYRNFNLYDLHKLSCDCHKRYNPLLD